MYFSFSPRGKGKMKRRDLKMNRETFWVQQLDCTGLMIR